MTGHKAGSSPGAEGAAELAPTDVLQPPLYVRQLVLEPAPPGPAAASLDGLVVLTSGSLPDAKAAFDAGGLGAAIWHEVSLDASIDELADLLAGAAEGLTLIDLRAVGMPPDPTAAVTAVFRLARAAMRTERCPSRVVAVTDLGGRLGLDPEPARDALTSATRGAFAGAWKAVAREWCDGGAHATALQVVDLPTAPARPEWAHLAATAACAGPLELGLSASGAVTPVLRSVPTGERDGLDSDSVVVLLGGARGIVALLGEEMARRHGCRMVVVGRTAPLLSAAASGVSAAAFDPRAARELARQHHPDAKPKELNRLVEAARKQHDVAVTLAGLRGAGAAEVVHVRADVADASAVAALLADARERFGRVDVVVHGAGIDRSRALERKDEAELAAVLAPKVGAIEALVAGLAGARLVAFTSVSGRFGNAGQIDYAAANDALARAAVGSGGLALDYTAWAEVGMAAPLARAMRERGVDPLPPGGAVEATLGLIESGVCGEWVLSGRLARRAVGAGLTDSVAFDVPGAELERSGVLRLEERAWLRDHRSTSAGLVPGVGALAAMAQAASALEPTLQVVRLRDAAFELPLKAFPGRETAVRVRATRGAVEDHGLVCATQVDSITDSARTRHHAATVVLGARSTSPKAWARPARVEPGPTAATVYKTFFHGPSFQVLDTTEVGEGTLIASSPPLTLPLGQDLDPVVRTTALAREVAFQAAGVWLLSQERLVALPIGVEEIEVYDRPSDGEVVVATARRRGDDARDDIFGFDVELTGADGRVLEVLRRLRFRKLASL